METAGLADRAPGPTPGPSAGASRVYRRTLGTRLLAAALLALMLLALVTTASQEGPGTAFFVLAALTALAALNLAAAFGDRVRLDDHGIETWNGLLARLGRPPRRVAWTEIVAVREHHGLRPGGGLPGAGAAAGGGGVRPGAEARSAGGPPRALFLSVRTGRRIVLDALERFEEVRATVLRRAGDGTAQ